MDASTTLQVKKLLWKNFACDKEVAHENRCIKRPSQLRFEGLRVFPNSYFSPSECPGLFQHRPGHSLGEKLDELVEHSNRSWLGLFMQRFSWARSLMQAKNFHNNFFLLGVCLDFRLRPFHIEHPVKKLNPVSQQPKK